MRRQRRYNLLALSMKRQDLAQPGDLRHPRIQRGVVHLPEGPLLLAAGCGQEGLVAYHSLLGQRCQLLQIAGHQPAPEGIVHMGAILGQALL
ncbi:hypothetical protein D3C75_925590 [compost metagenome]